MPLGSPVLSRNVLLLVLVSFLVTAGFGAVNMLIPYYILALKGVLADIPERLEYVPAGRAVVEMGVLAASFMATRSVFAALSGWASDVVGRKRMVVAGMALYVAVGVLYYYSSSVWELVVLRGLQGIASALVWPVAEAIIVDSVPAEVRARALSLYVVSMNIGHVGGPAIGVAAYEASKTLFHSQGVLAVFRAPFLLIAAVSLPGLAAALLVREPLRGRRRDSARLGFTGFSVLGRWQKRALLAFYVNGLINGFGSGIAFSVMLVYIIEFVAKDPQDIGFAMVVSGLAGMLAAYPGARLVDRLSPEARKTLLVALAVASRTLLAAIAFVGSLAELILVMSGMNILFNIFMPALRSIQASIVPQRLRGRVFGLQQAFFNTGMIAGPLVGSTLYHALYHTALGPLRGPQVPFILAALLGYAGAAVIAAYYNPAKTVEEARRLEAVLRG